MNVFRPFVFTSFCFILVFGVSVRAQWNTHDEFDIGIRKALKSYNELHDSSFTNSLELFLSQSNSEADRRIANLFLNIALFESADADARALAKGRTFSVFTNMVGSSVHSFDEWPEWFSSLLYVSYIEQSGTAVERRHAFTLCTNYIHSASASSIPEPSDTMIQEIKRFYGVSDFSLGENLVIVTGSLAYRIGEYLYASNIVSTLPEAVQSMVLE